MIGGKELVQRLKSGLEETLEPLIPYGAPCALLAYPSHRNIGDSYIWLGVKAYLRSRNARVVYACDVSSYSREQLARRIGRGLILLTGGGNVGDLWPEFERFREKVLVAFPDNPIVQLPQSMFFRERANLQRAKRIFEAHPNFTLLLRDQASLEWARKAFKIRSALCPDMAFALGSLLRRGQPSHDSVWLIRKDTESADASMPKTNGRVLQTDWHTEPAKLRRTMLRWMTRTMKRHPRRLGWLSGGIARQFDGISRTKLQYGTRLISRGSVVVTDYMHGHILSVLLSIPHVVMNNSDGKVENFYNTWTKGCALVHWAESPREALELSERLMSAVRNGHHA